MIILILYSPNSRNQPRRGFEHWWFGSWMVLKPEHWGMDGYVWFETCGHICTMSISMIIYAYKDLFPSGKRLHNCWENHHQCYFHGSHPLFLWPFSIASYANSKPLPGRVARVLSSHLPMAHHGPPCLPSHIWATRAERIDRFHPGTPRRCPSPPFPHDLRLVFQHLLRKKFIDWADFPVLRFP